MIAGDFRDLIPISEDGLAHDVSVLVVKPSSLGDVVHTLPAVHALKRARPDLRISWLINSEWAPLLAGNADLDGTLEFPRRDFRGLRGWLRVPAWLRTISSSKPGLALDFQGLTRSALLARAAGAQRVHCLGDAELIPRLLADRVVPADRISGHAIERYLRLVADLGVAIEEPLQFPLPPGTKPDGFDLNEPFLLVHPFSRGADKSLAEADVQQLCELLQPVPIVLAGRTAVQFEAPKNCVNLLNRTSLEELIWLIRRAHFTLSVDSGPMHIAAALTARLLSIHTWTDPRIVGPYQPEAWVWKNEEIKQVRALPETTDADWKPFRKEHVPKLAGFLREQFTILKTSD
ncbi:MAG: hypothetical protein QOD99_249 [Chthoniobacter sp.]|nr:hypothetical protein [Chthoniobacter sp.]